MNLSVLATKQSEASKSKESSIMSRKVARLSSGSTIGAAIVEAENSLEIEVCFPASGEAF